MLLGQFALVALLTLALGGGVFHVAASILENKEREKIRLLAESLARETALTARQGEFAIQLLMSSRQFAEFHETNNYHELQALFDRYRTTFTALTYVNPQGRREYAASGTGYTDRVENLAADPVVAAALAEPGRIAHGLRPAGAGGRPMLFLALAARTPFGDPMGAILAAEPVAAIAQGVLALHLTQGGGAVLADAGGRLLFTDGIAALPEKVTAGSALDKALAGQRPVALQADFDGQPHLVAAAPVGKYGLSALVALPRRVAIDAEMGRLRLLVAAIAAGAAFLSTVAAMWWTGGIARPMARLAEAVRVAADGDLGVRAPMDGPSEAREVARAFNAMTGNLAASRDALTRANHSLESILANMNEALAVVDREGCVTMLNRAGGDMLGYAPDEAAGMPAAALFPPGDALRAFLDSAANQDLLAGGGISGIEKTLVRKDGRGVPVLVSLALLCGRGERKEGVVCLAMDVTERRRAEELSRARKAAEAVSRAKTEFLAVVSHEMRTPLNIVLGILEHLRELPLPPLSRAGLDQALAAGQTLHEVIVAMLDYASLEAGRVLLRRQPFDPRRLAAETVERYAVAARRRGVALSVFVAPDLPERLVGDPARLGQVMANLVSNAVRFTENGEAALRLFLSPSRDNLRPDARRRLLVHVRDTGIGIAEAQLEAVFAPFTQQDASSTRLFGGLGLGLAITRRLTALMEGSLCLTSREGEGTDVWLSLPAEEFSPAPSAAMQTPGLPDDGPGA